MAPSILIVQHSTDDPVGRLGHWLLESGCELRVVRCQLGEALPSSLTGLAGLVVLGGAMGAYDDDVAPWLVQTRVLLAEAVARDLPTLGICLGHQLLAVAAGGAVSVAPAPQIGVVGVGTTAAAADDPLFAPLIAARPAPARAVHFNHDVVATLPPTAVLLSSTATGVQAFRLGDHVWGVQFHPEVDLATVAEWAADEVSTGAVSRDEAERALLQIAAADPELERTWREFGHRFAEQVRRR